MTRWIIGAAAGVVVAGAALAAANPTAFAKSAPGLWEIAGSPGAAKPAVQCIADLADLAQFEHRSRPCSRNLVSNEAGFATFEYSCRADGFGRSKMTVITPRSIRIETQGISGGLPFNYVLQARRIGDCYSQRSPTRH